METGREGQLPEYEAAVALALQTAMQESGYPVSVVGVKADDQGEVIKVTFKGEFMPGQMKQMEELLTGYLGKEVRLRYETE